MTASGQCITCVASRNALCHEQRRECLMEIGMRIIIDGRRKSYVPFIKCNLTCICTLQNSQAMLCGYFRRYLKNSHLKFYIALLAKIQDICHYLFSILTATIRFNGHQREGSSVHDRAVILLLLVVICDVMYWRFVPIMQHMTHPLHHRASLRCGLSNE